MEKFDSSGYRDNLAKDLKGMRSADSENPELAHQVLDEEKNTTRYKMAEEVNAEQRPEKVEFFKKLEESIKEGNLDTYLEYKKSEEFYKPGTMAEVLNLSNEELQQIAKDYLLQCKPQGLERLYEDSWSTPRDKTEADMERIARFLVEEIGYKRGAEENKETDLFIFNELLKKDMNLVFRFEHDWDRTFIEPETALVMAKNIRARPFGMMFMKDGTKINDEFSPEILKEYIDTHPNAKIKLGGQPSGHSLKFIFSE